MNDHLELSSQKQELSRKSVVERRRHRSERTKRGRVRRRNLRSRLPVLLLEQRHHRRGLGGVKPRARDRIRRGGMINRCLGTVRHSRRLGVPYVSRQMARSQST